MRVLIASPRKTGNARLRCLLASAYGLELIGSRDVPDGSDLSTVDSWLADFPERAVVHTSFRHSPRLATLLARHGVTTVAVLRHPFDLLISIHEIAQHSLHKKGRRLWPADPWAPLAGRDLGDPAVLEYAINGFSEEIAWLKGWHENVVPVVRFEMLEAEPSRALIELAASLGEIDGERIAHAVTMCPAENMIWSSPVRGRRTPPVPNGSWRERFSADQLAILRDRYGDDVRRLDYELV